VELDHAARGVVADLLPEAISRGVDLGFERAEPVPVRGEPVMLAAMIRNLIDNALRFTPEGGKIDVAVYRDGATGVLRIEDTGPGVSPDEIGRIFEPFFRGDRPEGEGVGLGLSIVKRIVDRLGGSIEAVNVTEPGRTGLRIAAKFPVVTVGRGSAR
jgi:two-component system OmpR family sensor kinase